MDSPTRDTIVRWLDARSRRDFQLLASLTAADARWHSPVSGSTVGRNAVVRNVEEAFEETECFASELLALECRGDRAVAVLHNTGRRQQDELDSLQTLFLHVEDGLVAAVNIAVDDEDAVEAFWADAPDAYTE